VVRSPGSNREETEFQPGQGLEAVDFRNPRLVRVASIAAVEVSAAFIATVEVIASAIEVSAAFTAALMRVLPPLS
jgi:hypothetical protein